MGYYEIYKKKQKKKEIKKMEYDHNRIKKYITHTKKKTKNILEKLLQSKQKVAALFSFVS